MPSKSESDPVMLTVTARLYNAKPVKAAMETTLNDVRQAMGLEEARTDHQRRNKRVEPSPQNAEELEVLSSMALPAEEDSFEPVRLRSTSVDEQDRENTDDEFAGFDARLASPSEDDDEDISGSDEPSKATLPRTQRRPNDVSPRSLRSATSPEPSDSDSERSVEATRPKTRSKGTTMLPSLSVAGYVSGSESEPEDLADFVAPRKNRRGQRARQKIWEQKFGERAKHLTREDRNKGWDPRYGAQSNDQRQGRRRRRNSFDKAVASAANLTALGKPRMAADTNKHKDNEGPLHPSWEAKKAAKEKNKTAAFQGKKISFD